MNHQEIYKVEDRRRLAKKISERLSKSDDVRPFPAAVAQLTSACQDPNADSRTFASIIECDPALSVRILRMANSPMFCPSGQVKSTTHAVSLLGTRKLKSVAMTVAGTLMFSSGEGTEKERLRLRNHSIGCAVVARGMAGQVAGVDQDEAFLAGVFHDVGKLLFYDCVPNEYSKLDAKMSGRRLVEEEELVFGTTHEKVGLACAASWELPDETRAAIGWHHRPDDADMHREYAHVICHSDRLAKHWGVGSDASAQEDVNNSLGHALKLTDAQLECIEDEARRAYDETIAATR